MTPAADRPSFAASARLVACCGIAVALAGLLWIAFSGPFPLAEYCTRTHPTWVFGLFDTPRYTAVSGPNLLGALAGLAALYLAGLGLARSLAGRSGTGLLLVAAPAIFAAVLIPGYPLLSNDIFKYVFDGRVLAVYHENPFVRVPADFPDDRFLGLIYWKAVVNAHGPLWRGLEGLSAAAGGEQCSSAILAMKLWPTLAYAGTIAALLVILQRARPDWALPATLAYAWSPLVLLEALQNGHNDVVAVLPALLALWAGSTGRWRLAFTLLAIGALVKPLAVALGPVLLVAAWRAGGAARRNAAIGAGLAALLVLVAYAPFLNGLTTFQGLERSDLFSASPAELLMLAFGEAGWSLDRAMAASRLLTTGAFGVLAVLVLVGQWRGRLPLGVAATTTLLAYLLVGAQWFNPWYLLWLLPVALIAEDRRCWGIAILFSLLAPLTYLLQYDARLVVPVVFLPTAVAATIWWAGARWRRPGLPPAPSAIAPPPVAGRG